MIHSKAGSWNHLGRFKTSSFDFTYSDPGWGRSPGGGYSNALQYSCLEDPMDRRAWWGTVHRIAKNWTWLKQLILECKVKWALESITMNKANGDDRIQVELFQILKDDALKVLHSICQQIWKTQQRPQDWKRSVFVPVSKKGNVKEYSNYCRIALISHTSKVMLKILQARLQQYMNHEIPDTKARFRKGRGTRDQIVNIHWINKKATEFQKNIYFCYIDYTKVLTVWITTNCGKFFKRWEYHTTWSASREIWMQIKKQ